MKALFFTIAIFGAFPAVAVDLPTALQAALVSDPTLASAVANRNAALENVSIARAKLLPQLSLQGSQQRLNQTTTLGDKSSSFEGPTINTQLTLRQALYRPRDFAGLEIGRLQADYGEAKLLAAQSDLWVRTTEAWLDVLTAQAAHDIFERTLVSVAVAADQEKKRFSAGEGTRDVMSEAAAQLSLARAQSIESTLNLQARVQAFNVLTRLGVTEFNDQRLPKEAKFGFIPGSEEEFLGHVLAVNPELSAARTTELVFEKRVSQNFSDHMPSLDLIGSLARGENDTANSVLGTQYNKSVIGLQLLVPIYSGGGVSATHRQSVAVYEASKLDREALIHRLTTQIGADWKSLAGQRARAAAALELVQSAREYRRSIELGIKAGLRTWADLGAADLQLARRENEFATTLGLMTKTQARLLALLPATDPAWERWTVEISRQARS